MMTLEQAWAEENRLRAYIEKISPQHPVLKLFFTSTWDAVEYYNKAVIEMDGKGNIEHTYRTPLTQFSFSKTILPYNESVKLKTKELNEKIKVGTKFEHVNYYVNIWKVVEVQDTQTHPENAHWRTAIYGANLLILQPIHSATLGDLKNDRSRGYLWTSDLVEGDGALEWKMVESVKGGAEDKESER